jgi:hypothetical protein
MKIIPFFLFSLLLINYTLLISIEVGGHLTEDTTWSPVNNPYLVTETLYVDAGTTLTILPGTEVKISGASLTSGSEFNQNFWLYSGVSIAKFIQVDGRLIAEGTLQDSIIFTRMQNDPDFCWGTIRITEDAELCRFKYCKIEHCCLIGIALSCISKGLDFDNGKGSVRNCTFLNNAVGINSSSYMNMKELEIINNEFILNNEINPFLITFNHGRNYIMSSRYNYIDSPDVLICNNNFEGYGTYCAVSVEQMSFSNNTVSNCVSSGGASYFFNNEFINCNYAINGYSGDSLYIKNNRFIGGNDGINIDYGYVEITDNYFEGCDLDTGFNTSGLIFNNIINSGSAYGPGIVHFFNNISYNNENGIGICATSQRLSCTNNISMNNLYAFEASASFNNCIFFDNEELEQFGITGTPIFRNCIIDFPLEPPLIDGGGNIWVDSLQVQSLFEDINNGDFHLIEGSLAIDAGSDTLGYYYPFDMDYNIRVWDGDNNGSAIIDIGPYEYGSPAFGGIEGYTYNPTTGEPVNYVLLKINNEPGEFTFSDENGSFEIKLPAGIYDIYAERVFYEDIIEYQIEVFDGEFTQLYISMTGTVDMEESTIISSASDFNLTNFPNPFNPTTTINFSLPEESNVNLSVYNVKGQKVKQLVNEHFTSGQHSIVWSGKDNNNKSVSSGIYFYKISAGKSTSMRKMLLLK